MKKFSLGACVALCAVTAAVTVSLTYMYAMDTFNERVADVNQRQAMYSKLSEIDQTIRQNFVGKIDETALTDGICAGYLTGLGDADAKYLTAEQYKSYVAGTSSSAVGAGISTVKDTDGNMEVTEVAPGSPAAVSYTHLDVYKRQARDSVLPWAVLSSAILRFSCSTNLFPTWTLSCVRR